MSNDVTSFKLWDDIDLNFSVQYVRVNDLRRVRVCVCFFFFHYIFLVRRALWIKKNHAWGQPLVIGLIRCNCRVTAIRVCATFVAAAAAALRCGKTGAVLRTSDLTAAISFFRVLTTIYTQDGAAADRFRAPSVVRDGHLNTVITVCSVLPVKPRVLLEPNGNDKPPIRWLKNRMISNDS